MRLVACAVAVVLLALFVYEPVPEGWLQPWKTRTFLASYRLNLHLGNAADALGFNGLQLKRFVMDFASPYIMRTSHLSEVISEDTHIAGVRVRFYTPGGRKDYSPGAKEDLLPAIIFYHGGGWATGSVETHDNIVRRMVKDLGVYAISVEYRLAPEHKYPLPLEDCVIVTKHLLSNAKEFSIDSSRVALAGDSAGGNFAAAISLRLRDENFPVMPKLQVLIYPVLQLFDLGSPSYQGNKDGPLLLAKHVGEFTGLYLQGHTKNTNDFITNRHVPNTMVTDLRSKYLRLDTLPNDDLKRNYEALPMSEKSELWDEIKDAVTSPYVSPLAADNLEGLPYAYILACQHDVLRDDGIWFTERLGSKAHLDLMNCFHGCMNFSEDLESVGQIMKKMNDFIRKYL